MPTVLLTGLPETNERFRECLEDAGWTVRTAPILSVVVDDSRSWIATVVGNEGTDGKKPLIIVTSKVASRIIADSLDDEGMLGQAADGWEFTAIGTSSAALLERAGLRVRRFPGVHTGSDLGHALSELPVASSRHVYLVGTRDTRGDVERILRGRRIPVELLPVYHTEVSATPDMLRAAASHVDTAVFTSPKGARAFAEAKRDAAPDMLPRSYVAIGEATGDAVRECGLAPCTVSLEQSPEGVHEAVERSYVVLSSEGSR